MAEQPGPVAELPTGLGPASMRGAVDTALRLIAWDLWRLLDRALPDVYGADWARVLGESSDRPVQPEDASSVVSLLLTSSPDDRDAVRDAVGRTRWRRMYQAMAFREVRRIRNRHAHPDGSTGDPAWAEDALSRLVAVARCGDLPCFADLRRLLGHVSALRTGAVPAIDPQVVARLEREVEAARGEAERIRARADDAEALLERATDLTAATDADLQTARDRIRQLEETHAADAGQRAALERELVRALSAQEEAAADLARSARQQQDLDAEREATQHRLQHAEQQLLRYEAALAQHLSATTTEDVAATVDDAASRPGGASDPEGSSPNGARQMLERLERRARDALADPLLTTRGAAVGVPDPGAPWPHPRGEEVWQLSARPPQLRRVTDDLDLAELLGAAAASVTVTAFLAVRPAGGRVWVDVDGDATSFVDGRLVYLGRLPQVHQASRSIRPGDPIDPTAGHGYVMSASGRIECTDTGQILAEQVPATTAAAVADRIRRVKPRGGRLRVSPDGIVTAFADRRWMFVTRVQPHEWFPGHVAATATATPARTP